MTDRRAELEKKRLKLQQLRELKEARRQEKESGRVLIGDLGISSSTGLSSPSRGPSSLGASLNSNADSPSIRSDITEVDDILKSVGIHAGESGTFKLTSLSTPLQLTVFVIFLFSLLGSNRQGNHADSSTSHHANGVGNNALTSPDSGTSSEAKPSPSTAAPTLSIATFPQVLIAPKENVTYEKQTQTAATQSTSSQDRGKCRLLPHYHNI